MDNRKYKKGKITKNLVLSARRCRRVGFKRKPVRPEIAISEVEDNLQEMGLYNTVPAEDNEELTAEDLVNILQEKEDVCDTAEQNSPEDNPEYTVESENAVNNASLDNLFVEEEIITDAHSTISSDADVTTDEEVHETDVFIEDSEIDKDRLQECRIEGRRIVNINHLFEEIKKQFDNHSPGVDCRFTDLIVAGSRQKGLMTEIIMQCRMCMYKTTICTEPNDDSIMDINHSAVAGSMVIGTGYSQTEELFSSMNIPFMSQKKYTACHENIADGFSKAARAEMTAAAEEEKALAIQRGDITDGIPHIPVVVDGSWMQRSYTTYPTTIDPIDLTTNSRL